MGSEAAGTASARSPKGALVGVIDAIVMPPALSVGLAVSVDAILRGAELPDVTGFRAPDLDTGRYGFAGCAAVLCVSAFYSVPRAIYGGPGKPSCKAGDGAMARFEPRAAEDS